MLTSIFLTVSMSFATGSNNSKKKRLVHRNYGSEIADGSHNLGDRISKNFQPLPVRNFVNKSTDRSVTSVMMMMMMIIMMIMIVIMIITKK